MKNKYISLALIVLLFNSFTLLGQNLESSLSIYIYDESSLPLEGANISIKNKSSDKSYGSSSDLQGGVFFRKIEEGEYDIHIKFIGYYDYKESIMINSIN